MLIKVVGLFFVLSALIILFSSSPYFGVFGVLLQALSFSVLLCIYGMPFFGLLVVLIYVGGMLIVFLFSTVLSAERFPSAGYWEILVFWFVIGGLSLPYLVGWEARLFQDLSFLPLGCEVGLGEVFGGLSIITCFIAFVLLVALMVVLCFGYEHTQNNLRKL
uniref:NADH-ubiquinone oxidoreductase chain 6 n=1 Tax=Ophionereis sp. TaxID=3135531 RepID=A0AAU6PX90_9ECHI